MSIQKKIKKIMSISDRQKREIALRELAAKLGCSLTSTYTLSSKHLEDEVIRRIKEAVRSIRESRLWWIAFMSAVASVFSALAAWYAVYLTLR